MLGIIAAVQAAVSAGVEIAPLIVKLYETFKPGAPPPTEADFAAMQALEDRLTDELNAPLPPEEP